ncbi:MAG TPA: flagellar biosynthesis protein FlgM [Lentisphaeria bacterium]|nr:MAG: hypothetical protein A2X45_01470 [Lentisphaerae bacterium GWF2_50_93]HCE45228.1 flagellar biosynthesis protein FlgM [Lentisphaeria bacterium]
MKLKNALNVWGGGQLLAFSGLEGKTDYNDGLVLRTSMDSFGIDIKLPGAGRIKFKGKASDMILAGDFFNFNNGKVKGAFIDAHHLLIEGDCDIEIKDDTKLQSKSMAVFKPPINRRVKTRHTCNEVAMPIKIIQHENIAGVQTGKKILIGTKQFFNPALIGKDIESLIEARGKWINGIAVPKGVSGSSRRTLQKAFSQMKTQVYSPEGKIKHYWTTPDRWPHRQMWLWDSVFHAVGLRHIDIGLARDAISALFDTQKKDGMIAHMMNPYASSDITQPPIIALGIKLVNETSSSPKWIKELYPKLKKYIEWDLKNRDSDGAGLCEWFIEGNVNCRCGESGLDNSPRFDCAQKLDATDFNAYLGLECEIMSEFAKIAGHRKDVGLWKERHGRICRLINERLWSEKKGFYFDYNLKEKQQSDVYAVSGFLPLICGAPSKQQVQKLVAHMKNPRTFGTPLRLPSIARCNEEYYSKDMWRGPVWVATNWLIILGLKRYGYIAEAKALAGETMKEIEDKYMKYGTFFEFFDDRRKVDPPKLLRKGRNAPEINPTHQVLFDYGWTATLYADLAFKGVLGSQ